MRVISTKQSKVIGTLGLFGSALMLFICFTMGMHNRELAITTLAGAAYMLWLTLGGFFAHWLAFDQAYLIRRKGAKFERYLIEEITSVRTIPFFRSMGILWIRHASGRSFRTIVLDQDLTWIMSRAPRSAITPYWARKLY